MVSAFHTKEMIREPREGGMAERIGRGLDRAILAVAPKMAYRRAKYRFAYDAIDGSRTRKKRVDITGTGDSQLTEERLFKLRDTMREMGRNNPLVKGLLRTERNGVVGRGVKIQARTDDKGWNTAAEEMWKEEMVDQPCEVTGRFGYNQYLRMMYLSYRRDGDMGTILLDNGQLQAFEGEQCGRPLGNITAKEFDVVNGVAVSKTTKKVIGYYIGLPDKWGFIKPDSYKMYKARDVVHTFNPERFSNSRGEPALTSSIDFIEKLCKYVDAELVAACVNAAFTMFIAQKDDMGAPPIYGGSDEVGTDSETGNKEEKIGHGTIMYGEPGESAAGIGQTRPGTMFDPFIMRMLSFIGRPLCMPLMLMTLDFSGATFMNARFAYGECRDNWEVEQEIMIKGHASRAWRWWVERKINEQKLTRRDDASRHEVQCRKWPYVDPFREAQADSMQLENETTNRMKICARQGEDYADVKTQLDVENAAKKSTAKRSDDEPE